MDRVKLHAQERLDLDDARALQSLVYDYVQEALGGLFGHVRGALSVPTITQVENNGAPYITLNAFQFVTTTPIESGVSVSSPSAGTALNQFKTTVVTYEPTEESSVQISIDTARAYYQDYVDSYLWARPISVDTDQATRIRWSVSGGAEQTFSAETRESQRVAFTIARTEPAYADGEAKWAPIAQIIGWSDADNTGSLAQWQVVSAYEHDDARRWFGSYLSNDALTATQTGLAVPTTSIGAYPMTSSRSYRGFGVADQLAILRYKIAQMQGFGANDPTGTTTARPWYNNPLISLNGAHTSLETLETRRTNIVCIAYATIEMNYSTANDEYFYDLLSGVGVSAVRASPTRTNRVCVELSADLLDEPWKINNVICQQVLHRQLDQSQAHHYDYNRATFQPDTSYVVNQGHVGGAGYNVVDPLNNTATWHLDDYATSSGRGVNIEVLPHYTATEEAIEDQHGGHNHVDVMISTGAGDNLELEFNVSIFAIYQE